MVLLAYSDSKQVNTIGFFFFLKYFDSMKPILDIQIPYTIFAAFDIQQTKQKPRKKMRKTY